MEQILLAFGLHKETVTAKMMLSKTTKVKVRSLNGDTDFYEIVTVILQGDKLATYLNNLQRLRISKVDRSNKRK